MYKLYAGLSRWPTSGVQGNVQVPSPSWGKALLLYQKGNGRKEGNSFSCAGHRPGPVVLVSSESEHSIRAASFGSCCPGNTIKEGCVPAEGGISWAAEKQGPPPHHRLTHLPPPELSRNLQGHKCLWLSFS